MKNEQWEQFMDYLLEIGYPYEVVIGFYEHYQNGLSNEENLRLFKRYLED